MVKCMSRSPPKHYKCGFKILFDFIPLHNSTYHNSKKNEIETIKEVMTKMPC